MSSSKFVFALLCQLLFKNILFKKVIDITPNMHNNFVILEGNKETCYLRKELFLQVFRLDCS